MITAEYIDAFKKTSTYLIINRGVLRNELVDVLLGKDSYRITSQYEAEDTIPSQIIIGLHILKCDNRITNGEIEDAFRRINITERTVCLLLEYIDKYLTYKKKHNELFIDFKNLLDKIAQQQHKYRNLKCFMTLMESVNAKIEGK